MKHKLIIIFQLFLYLQVVGRNIKFLLRVYLLLILIKNTNKLLRFLEEKLQINTLNQKRIFQKIQALPLSLLMTWMDIMLYKSKVFQSTKENILSIYELTSMQVVMLKLTRHIALLSKIKNYRRVGKQQSREVSNDGKIQTIFLNFNFWIITFRLSASRKT